MRKLSVVLAFILFSLFAHAASDFVINESAIRAVVADRDITVTIPIVSNLPDPPAAQLTVELLDPADKVLATATVDEPIKSGANRRIVVLTKPSLNKYEEDQSIWYRVRYKLIITPDREIMGIVALGAIASQTFELTTAYPAFTAPGNTIQMRVHAANPATYVAAAGVQITATADFDEPASTTGTTNSSGDAVLKLHVPDGTSGDFNIKVEGRIRGIHREQEVEVRLADRGRIVVNTDKLLYQPGQSLHARAMAFDSSNRAIANEAATFTLRDTNDQVLFQDNVKTNAFGIASIDWELPDSVQLGEYELEFELADRESPQAQRSSVRVSRYDLPNFVVEATPDRTYYLAGQNAEVKVVARYLFGKELTTGEVKLVFQAEKRWDYQLRKYATTEEVAQTATLDHNGLAVFRIDLGSEHDRFKSENYSRFRDLDYSAYVTDPTTGKTEQRRFKLRISHDPIHVYISGDQSSRHRGSFFISTYYADGLPAECTVDISEDPQYSSGGESHDTQFLRTVKTNRYGLVKVQDLKLLNVDTQNHDHRLQFIAHDKQGRSIRYADNIFEGGGYLFVSTDKSLYQSSDPITVTLFAPNLNGRFIVEAIRDGKTVWSGRIRLRDHRGFTSIPPNLGVEGELHIVAYSMESVERNSDYDYRNWAVSRTVLFPRPTRLDVKIKTDRNTYRPGEPVSAIMHVSSTSRTTAAPAALGVVVVDKAVEERIRNDQDFSEGHYGFWDWNWWFHAASVGGINREDLDQIDLSQPLPEGLDLVAELILSDSDRWDGALRVEASSEYDELDAAFRANINKILVPVRSILSNYDSATWHFPTNSAELAAELRQNNIALDSIRDPWNQPFRFAFGVEGRERFIHITSAGPDKRFDTDDDLSQAGITFEYFRQIRELLDRAIKETYTKSGAYILNFDALRTVLRNRGVDLNAIADPWGNPYIFEFKVDRSRYQMVVSSRGADTKAQPFSVWTSSIDYFSNASKSLDDTLAQYSSTTGKFPQTDADFDAALAATNNNFRSLLDPWGHSYSVRYHVSSDFSDMAVFVYTPDKNEQSTTPVTLQTAWIEVWSNGPDGTPHTFDDFDVASFSRIISQQSSKDINAKIVSAQPNIGNSGAIRGVITDPTGAVIPGVSVTATAESSGATQSVTTGESGAYLIRNLVPGIYELKAEMRGFQIAVIKSVPVHSSSVTQADVTLRLGTTSEVIAVEAEPFLVNTSVSSLAVSKVSLSGTKAEVKEETFTPRVRDFFPETLYWSPSVITDTKGRAKLNFKLADNITTWKMSVVASTKDGQIGALDTEFQSFQPFFADLDPPKILTVGDLIELPVTVRNYLPTPQNVEVGMKPDSWFELQQKSKQQLSIPASESANAVFPFLATAAIKKGKQQVSAVNRQLGDAIEKPVTVHPDGLEQSVTVTDIVRGSQALRFNVPANVIPGSLEGQLKVYPNLLSHVVESIEAGLHRPYGCGEQTISSTYPSLLLLQFEKTMESKTQDSEKATRYLTLGLRRLVSYRDKSGGFTYWGHGNPDLALTAYAIRFLNDAAQVTDVDPDLVKDAARWLRTQQKSDGSWQPEYGRYRDNSSLTAYIALTLASSPAAKEPAITKANDDAVHRAFQYLSDPHQPIAEPYALSEFVLLAHQIGEKQFEAAALSRLQTMSSTDKDGTYWSIERNTLFYSWGRTGRIESTALAVTALATTGSPSSESHKLLDAGTLYLLRQQDHFGVWYSGQTTVNVLKALLVTLGNEPRNPARQFTVSVNGNPTGTFAIPAGQIAPTMVDLSHLQPGENKIELTGLEQKTVSTAQAVATYYIPWSTSDPFVEQVRSGKSESLRLVVNFDRTEASVGDNIKCSVTAERVGSRGWGMMIAEIGLPPGADVDRQSLNKILADSGWDISHFDVLPDRLQIYLWPRAGGSKFDFTFRPRFGIKARTASSQLYDYYNPEAQISLSPINFHIRAK